MRALSSSTDQGGSNQTPQLPKFHSSGFRTIRTPTTPRVRVEDANTGQLGTETRGRLMDILENFNSQGLFRSKTDNIKTLPGRKVTLLLKDENIRPIACK